MHEECRQQRRQSRHLERQYRRTQSPADRQAWVEQERTRHQVYRQKERADWSAEITSQAGESKKLWRTFKSILGRDQSGRLPKSRPTSQQFLDCFSEKVEVVRQSTVGSAAQSMLPDADTSFDAFERCTIDDVKRVITSAPSKYCEHVHPGVNSIWSLVLLCVRCHSLELTSNSRS